jgi:hypothetical protein
MMEDPRTRDTVVRFHALWMDFEQPRLPGDLSDAMQTETKALLMRVLFEDQRPWQDLLRYDQTYVTDNLARHYGFTSAGVSTPAGAPVAQASKKDSAAPSTSSTWVSYPDGSGRKGLLSHASFLATGAMFVGDTSPTIRGLIVRERLHCQDIPDPPPGVATDDPPPETEEAECKEDRYHFHKEGGCGKCHRLMDPIGFGLERYDEQGRYRTHEPKKILCILPSEGVLSGVGFFSGPAELSGLLLRSGQMNQCLVTQLYRFAMGRYKLDAADSRVVQGVTQKLGGPKADFRFQDLLLTLVSSSAFRHRRDSADRVE